MKSAARSALAWRRLLLAGWGAVAWLVMATVVGRKLLPEFSGPAPSFARLIGLGALSLLGARTLIRAIRGRKPEQPTSRELIERARPILLELESGLGLTVVTYAIIAMTGGAKSPLYPLIYALIAFLITFARRGLMLIYMALGLSLEFALLLHGRTWSAAGTDLIIHCTFWLMFAALHLLFLRGELWRIRRQSSAALIDEIRSMREEARDFRLISTALGGSSRRVRSREDEETKLYQGAVETIHQSLYHTLELLKSALDLQTCLLLWLDDSGAKLKVKELVTDTDGVIETPIHADVGALGAIVRERVRLNLKSPKRSHVGYYAGDTPVGAFVGVPVIENGRLRGVLCADRATERAFEPNEETLLVSAATQILRAIQSERVFAAVERGKYEHERFYRASELLRRCLTPEQVFDTTFQATSEIVPFDFGAITLFDRDLRRHTICRVVGEDREALEGKFFSDNAGIASMVVKNRHFLPASGELRDPSVPVYTRRLRVKAMESLLVLPLIRGDEAIGTLALGSRRKQQFSRDLRDMLGVIANQVAASLESAQMYRRMEQMATTDGLTGLTNHRTFQERLSELISRSARLGKSCTLILTDIDHFKKVNDTYGHPIGDLVLRRVAEVLKQNVRQIDVVARYGGEEFALVLEETDARGALILAERIREDVAKQDFSAEGGPPKVTLSLGIATFPSDGEMQEKLIARADQALYAAKHGGRNRAVLAKTLGPRVLESAVPGAAIAVADTERTVADSTGPATKITAA